MVREYKGQKFMTDNDLSVKQLGFLPRIEIKSKKLREELGRAFLGGDEIIAYMQTLVSKSMNFGALEEEMIKDMENPEKPGIKETVFNKTATGIGRGHSLGGLPIVSLGLTGTKMLDSGLTGIVASRSLATSSRRRETTTEEIIVPESLFQREDLLDEYLKIARDVFSCSKEFKEKFGKLGGVETFNKVIPYNNPANIDINLPLDSMATLAFEARADLRNPRGPFIPKEVHDLVEKFTGIAEDSGMAQMFAQRVEVPRDGYFHYTVFKDPFRGNSALEKGIETGMKKTPVLIDSFKDFTPEFMRELGLLKQYFEEVERENNPEKLLEMSQEAMERLREFSGEFNESVRARIADSLSWRVWSEQKRHATLRQNNESIYSAADRAVNDLEVFWPLINYVYEGKSESELNKNVLGAIENSVVTDDRLKKNPELLNSYLYHTARQVMFYNKLLKEGFSQRDALYTLPKNIRVRTMENYDLVNLINLELPLRLCSTCEPERQTTSWQKQKILADAFPELEYFLQPKCNVGFCTEVKYCKQITDKREYDKKLHQETKKAMLEKSRDLLRK